MTGQPKAIFFDMDGTLVDWQTGMEDHWRDACATGCLSFDAAIDPAKLYDAVVARRTWFWDDDARSHRGRMDLDGASRQIVEHALADLGVANLKLATSIATDYRAQRAAALVCYPGAVETLEAIRARGITMALITNGEARNQRRTIEQCGIESYFGCIVIEGEFGCGKPDQRVFHHALAACNVDPADTWMVGDNHAADIVTPHALGMHTVWVDETGAGLPAHASVRPHRVIRAIAELIR